MNEIESYICPLAISFSKPYLKFSSLQQDPFGKRKWQLGNKKSSKQAIRKVESIRHKTARKFDKWKLWSLKKTIENMPIENFENIKINKGRRKKNKEILKKEWRNNIIIG